MDHNLLIQQEEIGNYRISIYYDTDAECPVTNWDLCGCYLFEYSDRYCHTLHKECDWKELFYDNKHSLEEALHSIAASAVKQKDIIAYLKQGKVEGVRLIYNKSSHCWELQTEYHNYKTEQLCWNTECELAPYDLKNYDYRFELLEHFESDELIALINDCANDMIIKEWGTTGYSQGDYVEGIAYVTKERYDKMCGRTDVDWRQYALECIDEEVKSIGMWMWGDVKGFILEEKVSYTKQYHNTEREDEESFDWEQIDSCWGYFMETEELIAEVISEHDLKEMVCH